MLFYLAVEAQAVLKQGYKEAVVGEASNTFDFGVDTFGANDIAFDVNREVGSNSALRINFHSDTLENHRDHYEVTGSVLIQH